MENGAFAPVSKCSIFHNIFKYVIFQRRQKALLWNKGLIQVPNSGGSRNVAFKIFVAPNDQYSIEFLAILSYMIKILKN